MNIMFLKCIHNSIERSHKQNHYALYISNDTHTKEYKSRFNYCIMTDKHKQKVCRHVHIKSSLTLI